MSIVKLQTISEEEFDAFGRAWPTGNWLQTSAMAAFRTTLGWETHLLGVFKGSSLTGIVLLAGKAGRYEVTMGPLLPYTRPAQVVACLEQLAEYVDTLGGYLIEVYPQVLYTVRKSNGKAITSYGKEVFHLFQRAGYHHKGFTKEYDPVANRWVFVKDLSGLKTEDDLLRSYRQTTRQIIKKLDSSRYSVKKLSYDELPILKKLIDSSNTKNDVPGRPLEYYQHLYTSFGKAVEFLVVYYDGSIPLAGAAFIHQPQETVYFVSGTDTKHRHLQGAHFLQHHVMMNALKAGQARYNFYGISGNFEHNPLLVYKAGFRGVVEEYIGGFSKVVRPTTYRTHQAKRALKSAIRKVLR